jgi:hypothetical protein
VSAEPPLGVSINEMIPTGEPHEVAASLLGEAYPDDAGRLLPSVAGSASPGDEQRGGMGSPQPPVRSARRRRPKKD